MKAFLISASRFQHSATESAQFSFTMFLALTQVNEDIITYIAPQTPFGRTLLLWPSQSR